jgi:hypothetical protein
MWADLCRPQEAERALRRQLPAQVEGHTCLHHTCHTPKHVTLSNSISHMCDCVLGQPGGKRWQSRVCCDGQADWTAVSPNLLS